MEERRRHVRIQPSMGLEIKVIPDIVGHTRNISVGGIQFISDTKYELGAIVELGIKVASMTGAIEMRGKVLRCEPMDDGKFWNVTINYIDMDRETEIELEEIIKSFS